MATLTDARAAWIEATPKPDDMTQEDYDAMADLQAPVMLDELNRRETEAVRKMKRKQFVDGMAGLRTNLTNLKDTTAFNGLTATNKAEFLRRVAVDNTQALIWLGETLQDLGLLEKNGT